MRKRKYDDNFPLLAEGWAREGLNDQQIAKNLGIGIRTYYEYQKKYPQFSQAIARGKAPVDREVENVLLQRVRGFDYEEVHVKFEPGKGTKGEDGKEEPVEIKKIKKKVLPDPNSIFFWLKNRMPKKWRERHEMAIGGAEELPPVKIVPVDGGPKKKEQAAK